MQEDIQALSRYRARKIDLEELLKERELLLHKLAVLVQTAMFSSSISNFKRFDVILSQDLLVNLAQMETTIEDLITEINTYAEKCGEAPIK